MSDAIPVANRAGLTPAAFEPLRLVLSQQSSMRKALDWFFAQSPPLVPEDLVAQDEFSHDLLVPYPGGLTLSYDTT